MWWITFQKTTFQWVRWNWNIDPCLRALTYGIRSTFHIPTTWHAHSKQTSHIRPLKRWQWSRGCGRIRASLATASRAASFIRLSSETRLRGQRTRIWTTHRSIVFSRNSTMPTSGITICSGNCWKRACHNDGFSRWFTVTLGKSSSHFMGNHCLSRSSLEGAGSTQALGFWSAE